MQHRLQRTIGKAVETSGVGFLTGADISIRFVPAAENHGIVFERTDVSGSALIPANIEYAVPRQRRTAIENQGTVVEMTEHVMAALAGLQIDNCLVQIDAPEPPGCDGSSLAFVDVLLEAGAVEQTETRPLLSIERTVRAVADDGKSEIEAKPLARPTLAISFQLDYGPRSPIHPQTLTVEINPVTFVAELAYARTFVLEAEVEALKAQGYGSRTTASDLLVFGPNGVIDNQMRSPNECARHKILDCLGDLALIGCDVHGHISAYRSGHQLNREIVRRLQTAHPNSQIGGRQKVA